MSAHHVRLALAVALVAVTGVEAQFGRRSGNDTPTPLAVTLLDAIDDANLGAELKLSDEQVKQLVARRQEVWDEGYATPPTKFAAAEATRAEATDNVIRKVLSAEQYKRAVQIAAQRMLLPIGPGSRTPDTPDGVAIPGTFLRNVAISKLQAYPELVVALQLTDEQKRQLRTPVRPAAAPRGRFGAASTTPSITLTTEQIAAAKQYLGDGFVKFLARKRDPRQRGVWQAPHEVSVLAARDVRSELRLTDDQLRALAPLRSEWARITDFSFQQETSPKDLDDLTVALTDEMNKKLAATLSAEQNTRLCQIAFQARTGATHIETLYQIPSVAREFGLKDTQVQALESLWVAYRNDVAKVFQTATAFAPTQERIQALQAARRGKAESVLTPEQAANLQQRLGEPFTGSTQADSPFTRNSSSSTLSKIVRAANFGQHSTTELSLLSTNRSIQEALKLTEAQIKRAGDVRDEIMAGYRLSLPRGDGEDYIRQVAERSKAVEAAVSKLLSAEQATRFREIMLQSREPRGAAAGQREFNSVVPSPAGYPGVAEAIKLTAEQKKLLIDGDDPAQVLTAAQKTAIAGMLGEPYKGDFTTRTRRTAPPAATRSRGSPLPTLSPSMRLFTGPTPASDLKRVLGLTEEQQQQIAKALETYQATGLAAMPRGVPAGARPAGPNLNDLARAMTAAMQDLEKAVNEALSPEQRKRLPQLALQAEAANNLTKTLTGPEVAKALGLTAGQTEKLEALDEDSEKLQSLFRREALDDRDQTTAHRLRDEADARLLAVLTKEQQAKWKEMTGEPWPGLTKSLGGTGFLGGFSGGRVGGGGGVSPP